MTAITLDNGFTLRSELHNKILRLIIYRGDEEVVCRKTTFREMNKFLAAEEMSLFKGRLQLFKNQDYISVKAKKDIIGKTNSQALESFLKAQAVNS